MESSVSDTKAFVLYVLFFSSWFVDTNSYGYKFFVGVNVTNILSFNQ